MRRKRVEPRNPEPLDWARLFAMLVHPTKVQIVEAMWWIDRPLSASEIQQVLDGEHSVSALSYHFKTLVELGVLTGKEKVKVRAVWKRLYVFSSAVKEPSRG